MNKIILFGRGLSKFYGEGEALVSREAISFFGGVDPYSGKITDISHHLRGHSVKGKILVFPHGKGSTVGAYTLYQMSKLGTAPAGIINIIADHVTIVGCILSNIPLIDDFTFNPIDVISNGDYVRVDGRRGVVEIVQRKLKGNFS
ncbi:MAG: DUF126 domain-containing protein [Candidatus Verstraetearchaeota archaeon]|nr:DUF126 domain-containing protein [Candidatus Verstraetearchaeota archaeon]